MYDGDSFFYEVIATHRDGSVVTANLSLKQSVSIGSNTNAKLRLSGFQILPIHADLLVTDKDEVLVVNLGESAAMLLNGKDVPTFIPTKWTTSDRLRIGDYEVRVVTGQAQVGKLLSAAQASIPGRNSVEFAVDTDVLPRSGLSQENSTDLLPLQLQDNTTSSQSVNATGKDITEETTWHPQLAASINTRDEDKIRTDVIPQAIPQGSLPPRDVTEETTWRPPLPEIVIDPFPAEESGTEPWQIGEVTAPYVPEEGRTERYLAVVPGFNSVSIPSPLENTLLKNWAYSDKLSAQVTLNPINVATGERIRIPISVRNENTHSVDLHVIVAGLPSGWTILSKPRLQLGAGEIRSLDLILQTQPTVAQPALDLALRFTDMLTPRITLTLPLRLILKRTPDLVGWLDPSNIRAPGPAYLYLQNHTQSTAKIFIAGYSETIGLHVVVGATWIELPPGQITSVAISVDIRHRPLLRSVHYPFWVSAKQGNRAALDFAGIVWVRPRLAPALRI